MQTITHQEQQERWDKEHEAPNVLLQMDSSRVSSGVIKFLKWLKGEGKQLNQLKGLEICCGKGRNVIGLAVEGATMVGLDFSQSAIEEAKKRAIDANVVDKTQFFVQDVTQPFPIEADSLDFAFDCFGSTDIESAQGREAALDNMVSVLKPGGYLFVYLLSSDDEFQKEMIAQSPGPDAGSFIHPVNRKYERVFTEDEVKDFYGQLELKAFERVAKKDTFFGKEYSANHIWAVFQK